jgi:iron complex outermembrane recepter protein
MSAEIASHSKASVPSARRLLAASLIAGLAAGPSLAQNAGGNAGPAAPGSDQLTEIVVTAQFRSENLQQTPLAITAITGQMIADRSMTNVTDVAADVPSVTLLKGSTAFGPSVAASIRGIGQYDFDPALEPGVGIYVDDVYYATLTGSALDLLDLERVEVLRGPQGTLEGMNSIGGAVKLFSQKPSADESNMLDVLYGSRNHIEARGSSDFVAIPDQLFVRMSAVYNHQDGYVNVFDFGCSHPSFTATPVNPMTGVPNGPAGTYSVAPGFVTHAGNCLKNQEGGTDYQGLRLAARWLPSSNLEINVTGDITQQDQENAATTLLYANKPVITVAGTNTATGATAYLPYSSALVPSIISPNRFTSYAGFSMPAFAGGIPFPTPANILQAAPAYSVPDASTLLSWGTSATVDWKLNDTMSIKSISSFRGYSSSWYEDNDASLWPVGLGGENLEHHQFSQELRFNGSVGSLLDYTLGGFYFDENSVYGTHQDLYYAVFPGALDFLGDDTIPAKDKAGFLHTVWHLTDKLNFIAAVRYTSQTKDYTYVRVNPEGGTGGSAVLVGGLNGVTGHYSADKTDYRADVDYQWTENFMTYAQVSTGFKGGGINPRPFYAFQAVPFQPETVTTYEAGIKSSWFSNSLKVNLDGYYSQYKDIQLALLNCDFLNPPGFPPGQPCALPFNAGDADIKGVELEVEAHPFNGMEIDANGDYLNFHYSSLSSFPTGVTSDMTTPFTPEWQGHAGMQYSIPLGGWGSVTPRIDATMRTQIWTNAVNAPTNHIGGYTLYNARVTWKPEKGNWEASLLALNLTDKFYYLNVFDLTGAGGGSVTGTPGAPLEVAIEIKHKF